jgi:hypothetical protein
VAPEQLVLFVRRECTASENTMCSLQLVCGMKGGTKGCILEICSVLLISKVVSFCLPAFLRVLHAAYDQRPHKVDDDGQHHCTACISRVKHATRLAIDSCLLAWQHLKSALEAGQLSGCSAQPDLLRSTAE